MLSANTAVKSNILRLHSAYTLIPENTCNTRVFKWHIHCCRNCVIGLTRYNNESQLKQYTTNPSRPYTARVFGNCQSAILMRPDPEDRLYLCTLNFRCMLDGVGKIAQYDSYRVTWNVLHGKNCENEAQIATKCKYQCRDTPFLGPNMVDFLIQCNHVLV
jgi:hypothetical protein